MTMGTVAWTEQFPEVAGTVDRNELCTSNRGNRHER